jgi:hypothetical protein
MFRPVQNPDDEEVEGRVRTRTRTKELVYLLLELSGVDQRTSLLELLFSFHFFSPFSVVLFCANDGGTERAESTQARQR